MAEALVYINGKPTFIDELTVFSDSIMRKIHRPSLDGPAICMPDGSEYYLEKGKFHREDGPAIHIPKGVQEWWVNGKKHRTDGPAVFLSDGSEEWWVNGERHRLEGPAIIRSDGYESWYLNGKKYSQKQWLKEREKWMKH